ncbi:MAG TPA: CPBP family intramembrane glutamic endopeptidase [Anaerolineales bacterium]|nr:CPBP family intramembrane glutamic endopeptidase [Anaerolineales bacterium]
MSTNNPSIPLAQGKKHTTIGLLLLAGLLFLRFPFLIGADLILPEQPTLPRTISMFVFMIGTYLLTAVLIWWEREHLRDFWIDLAAGITFLLQLFCFPIGIVLFRAMRRHQARFPSPPANLWRWALLGAVLAIVCNIFVIAGLGIEPPGERGSQPAGFGFLLPAIILQMTMAGVFEEPLFRGFLWGYLRRAHWQDSWIWPFQALLFTLGHVYYLQTEAIGPWFLRIGLPALLIGFVAWQAKSIFASIVTHGFFNASGDMLLHTRSLSEAVNVGWIAVMIIIAIFAGLSLVEWIRHEAQITK